MIDWLSVKLPIPLHINGNRMVEVSPDWEVLTERVMPLSLTARDHDERPSWSSSIRIIPGDRMAISGNPAKFIQGHNVDGPEDPGELLHELLDHIGDALGQRLRLPSLDGVTVSRLDLTHTFRLPEGVNAYSATSHLAQHATVERKGRAVAKGHSISFGKATGETQLVIYDKGRELKAHLPADDVRAALMDLPDLDRMLRVELRVRRKYIHRHGLQALSAWNDGTREEVWKQAMAGLKISDLHTTEIVEEDKRGRLFLLVQAWMNGQLPPMSRATMFRNRSDIRRLYGVDIMVAPPEKDPTAQVISWIDALATHRRVKLDPLPKTTGSVISLADRRRAAA